MLIKPMSVIKLLSALSGYISASIEVLSSGYNDTNRTYQLYLVYAALENPH